MNSDDRKVLLKFLRLPERLSSFSFYKNVHKVAWTFHAEPGKRIEHKTMNLETEQLLAALPDVRKLFSKGEDHNMENVCEILIRNAPDQAFLEKVTEFRDGHINWLYGKPLLRVVLNGKSNTNYETLRMWAYGGYLHDDDDKMEYIKQLGPIRGMSEFSFIHSVGVLMQNAQVLSEYVRHALKEVDLPIDSK